MLLLKVAFVKFAYVFIKFRKLESLRMKNTFHRHKTEAATGGALQEKLFLEFWQNSQENTSSDWNSGNCSIESNNKRGFIKQPFTFVLQNRLRSVTLIKNTPVQMLSCEFCEIFKNPF